MNRKIIWMLNILVLTLVFTGCQKEEEINEAEVLASYLESTTSPLGKDFVNTDLPAIMTAEELNTLNVTNQVYIIDLRSAADFTTGHIKNAHNVALADLVTHMATVNEANYTKIAIVCYTGQTAGYAASLLRLLGHSKVFSLKWGMCSWNADFSSRWANAISNTYATQFVTTSANKNPKGELPVINTGKANGQDILEARVAVLLTEGFTPATVTAATVFGNPSNYYIVNYWPAAQYSDPGHIPGAIQYTPKETLKLNADLKTLPTDKTIVVYCYTGQTSAFVAAYLRLLGYDAKSLMFGANSMIYDIMVSKSMTAWKASEIKGYTYE